MTEQSVMMSRVSFSSSFGRASFPSPSQTGLGPMVYPFTTSGCCTARIRCCSDSVEPASAFINPMYGDVVRTWSAVCSEAPHLQFDEGARPHLCIDEWNPTTLVRSRLSLTQAIGDNLGQALSNRPGTDRGYKNTEPGCTILRVPSIIRLLRSAGCSVRQGCLIDSAQLAQMGV